MKYLIVSPKMRPTMKLTADELNQLFASDSAPATVRRPDLASEWAQRMNEVKEIDCRALTATSG